MNIPFLNFHLIHSEISKELSAAFSDVLDSNWFIMGSHLSSFEANYAKFNNTKYALGVSNGLDALVLCLRALKIGQGDEVILPAHTYIASALAVSQVGAVPVFVEPDAETYNINPKRIEEVITQSTKAIMPVHLYGQACEMKRICEIAEHHYLKVIEDNAQAHGSSFNGKVTGSWGEANATSFYPGKNLGALGDGGMVTSDSDEVKLNVEKLRNYGSQIKYQHELKGGNMRLDELQAAFLDVKLKYLFTWTAQRKSIAAQYNELLLDVGDIVLPHIASGADHVYHLYVIRSNYRNELQAYLKSKGIETLIHYPIPVHLQKAYVELGFSEGAFPITENIAQTCLSLPIWPGMGSNQVEIVSNQIKKFFTQRSM